MIDQTLLAPAATEEQVAEFCRKALPYGFASVCIQPAFVRTASRLLDGSGTKVCTVIDFPHGAGGAAAKCAEARCAIADGADELDFVVSLALVKAHDWAALEAELSRVERAVREAAAGRPVLTKLILETCLLSDEEIVETCRAAQKAQFDFVKTSTGFASPKAADGTPLANGATVHAVRLMRQTVGEAMGVKASGGIHTTEQALALVQAGASRIGASAGAALVDGLAADA